MSLDGNEKRILGVTSAGHFLTHLYELSFPAIALTLRDDLGWSLGEVLRLSFLMYLLFGLGALPMGLLADRWRARNMLLASMLGAGAGALLVALARTKAEMVAALALVGLCASIYHPAGIALLSRTMRARGSALGWNGIFGNLGSALAPFLAGVLAYRLGWRAAYAVLGALGIGAGLVCLAVHIDDRSPADHPVEEPAGGGGRASLVYFAILCAAMLLAGFSYRGTSLLLPAVFREQTTFLAGLLGRLQQADLGGVPNLAAALLASVTYAAGIVGQVLGGRVADRHDLRRAYLVFQAASVPFLLAMAFAREHALLLAACGFAFFGLGMQPIENSLVARFTPARWRSTGYGVKFVLNFGIGSTAVYGVTALQAHGSFALVFAVLAAVVVALCAVVALLLHRSRGVAVLNRPPVPVVVSSVALCCLAALAAPRAEARRLAAWPAPADTALSLPRVLLGAAPGDTIVLQPGLYRGTFTLRRGVSLLGRAGPDSTVLDADGERYVLYGRHLDSTTVIAGLTLRGGKRAHANSGGGGVYLYRSSPLVLGNVIHGNLGYLGPAVYMNYDCHPVVAFNILHDNEGYLGGAVAAYEHCDPLLYNNIVRDNRAVSGGGVLCLHASAVLAGNTMVGNRASERGGGGAIHTDGAAMLVAGNVLAHNADDHPQGGAVFCRGMPFPELQDNLFWENEGGEGGGSCDSIVGRHGNCAADPRFADLASRRLARRPGAGDGRAPQAGAAPWDLARPPAVPDSILVLWRAWRRAHGTH